MNNVLTSAVGLDAAIQSVQADLFSSLGDIWSGDIEGYGKIYKNPANTGDEVPAYYNSSKIVTPEWYNASKKDYEEVYYDDSKSCVFCFLVGDKDVTTDEVVYTADVKCVFMVNLEMLLPSYIERQDARAQRDAVNTLRGINFGRYSITDIQRGIDAIFYEYITQRIRFNDMQPLHSFCVNLKLNYYLTQTCT